MVPATSNSQVSFQSEEKYGGHKYTFADTGLDAGELRERMHDYQEYFDVPDEALP